MVSQPPIKERDDARELKVKIPVDVHVHLHSLKILTGKRISDVVTEALADYFRAHADPNPGLTPAPGLARLDARDALVESLRRRDR